MNNPNAQFNLAKAIAMAWFVQEGYDISLPISRHLAYDFIIDKAASKVSRVRVATTSYKTKKGNYEINLKTKARNKETDFDPTLIDLLFLSCSNKDFYLIESSDVTTKTKLSLVQYADRLIHNIP